jgi:hypothetical protein
MDGFQKPALRFRVDIRIIRIIQIEAGHHNASYYITERISSQGVKHHPNRINNAAG